MNRDTRGLVIEVLGCVGGLIVCVGGVWLLVWGIAGLINAIENAPPPPPWCHVVTTTGEIETQICPPGFNQGDRIYWDNEKKTYSKVG